MKRTILHSDMNNCYASIECLHRPELRGKPVAVGGDVEQRHGIILAKNDIAKKYGIKTGEALWQAQQKCPGLVIVPPNFVLYLRYSKLAREIYGNYTDQVEPYGLDECWLDVSGSIGLFGEGHTIAEQIRRQIKRELGITVSVGVADNKITAKLASDMRKPDAVTVITPENYQQKVWPLPASDLLYVGPATARKLSSHGILTIEHLAQADPKLLRLVFGKIGDVLWAFANGLDRSPVACVGDLSVIKSIGNSATTPRDLLDNEDVKMVLYVLAESVATRMREQGFVGQTVCISVRDNALYSSSRQTKLERPTCLASEIAGAAMRLFCRHYRWQRPIRSIGVSMTGFTHGNEPVQLDLYENMQQRENKENLERTVDTLRVRFGPYCVRRAVLMQEKHLTAINPKDEHTIHPYSYF